MNKSAWILSITGCCCFGAAGAGTPDAGQAQVQPNLFEQRANSALLFTATDRQAALIDQLQDAPVLHYLPASIGTRLHFGALPDNLALLDPLGPMLNDRSSRFLSSAEFEKKMGRAVGVLTIGILRESGAVLGSQQSPALAMNLRPTTTFTSASLGYALTPHSSLVAMASYGKTEGYGSQDSLIAQVSSVRTVAYSFGYSVKQVLQAQDRFAVTFSIPAKVRSGAQQFSGPAVQAVDMGAVGFGTPTLNLRPTATEHDLEMSYTSMFGKDGRLGKVTGAVMWRTNPGHDATARPDWMAGVRYSYGF